MSKEQFTHIAEFEMLDKWRTKAGLPTLPIKVELRYDARDPYAVTFAFRTRTGWIEWVFARDLLSIGIHTKTGEGDGDINIRQSDSHPETVLIELNSPSGHTVLEACRQELVDFLDHTYDLSKLYPIEQDSVDEALSKILTESV